ncbi:hypothetical protein BR93DRAFT_523321 [Coniochaeta sp. PMI_546]|nr:hypothetical protein BR93DRAFT_523321 [Coniochaeta sp. PMI_546]
MPAVDIDVKQLPVASRSPERSGLLVSLSNYAGRCGGIVAATILVPHPAPSSSKPARPNKEKRTAITKKGEGKVCARSLDHPVRRPKMAQRRAPLSAASHASPFRFLVRGGWREAGGRGGTEYPPARWSIHRQSLPPAGGDCVVERPVQVQVSSRRWASLGKTCFSGHRMDG